MMNPAARVLEKIGGAPVAATVCSVDQSTAHRWTYPKERRGTGGIIPAKHQRPLLEYARRNNLPLTAEDFFPGEAA